MYCYLFIHSKRYFTNINISTIHIIKIITQQVRVRSVTKFAIYNYLLEVYEKTKRDKIKLRPTALVLQRLFILFIVTTPIMPLKSQLKNKILNILINYGNNYKQCNNPFKTTGLVQYYNDTVKKMLLDDQYYWSKATKTSIDKAFYFTIKTGYLSIFFYIKSVYNNCVQKVHQ